MNEKTRTLVEDVGSRMFVGNDGWFGDGKDVPALCAALRETAVKAEAATKAVQALVDAWALSEIGQVDGELVKAVCDATGVDFKIEVWDDPNEDEQDDED